jgi:DNA polymerase III alpha subunit
VSQFDGPTLEYIGLLKMDFLGLRNLSVIKNCIKIIRAKYKNIDNITTNNKDNAPTISDKNKQQILYYREDTILFQEFIDTMSFNPDMNNTGVFEKVFMTGDTTGIFQFE